jgi:hypothetical protein
LAAGSLTVMAPVRELVLLRSTEMISELPAGTAWLRLRLAPEVVAAEVAEASRPT